MTDARGEDACVLGDPARQPKTVFLSMRGHFMAIPYFFEEVLPRIEERFVLVSGSEDLTLPNQVDVRWRPFNSQERGMIDRILADDRVIHWFAENRDEPLPKMSTLPVGYVFADGDGECVNVRPPDAPLGDRPLKVLCAHRVRHGRQWDVRRRVTKLCSGPFRQFATVLEEEVPACEFLRAVREHPFVACVSGGGLDPSPKAWICIANGSIPIIESSALDDAYRQLPVAFVDSWDESCLTPDRLRHWVEELRRHYDVDELRREALRRLSLDFWWGRIQQAYAAG